MDSIGFVWESHERKWNDKFEKLKAHRLEHGDCLVPEQCPKDKQLGLWAKEQWKNNNANKLSLEHKAKLDSIGFVWHAQEQQWNEMFDKLNAHVLEHGDFLVPH